jgi:hypothetical protein
VLVGRPLSVDAHRLDWGGNRERTARADLFVAVGAGVLAGVSHWDAGDLIVGVYFAAISLLLWAQSARKGSLVQQRRAREQSVLLLRRRCASVCCSARSM